MLVTFPELSWKLESDGMGVESRKRPTVRQPSTMVFFTLMDHKRRILAQSKLDLAHRRHQWHEGFTCDARNPLESLQNPNGSPMIEFLPRDKNDGDVGEGECRPLKGSGAVAASRVRMTFCKGFCDDQRPRGLPSCVLGVFVTFLFWCAIPR